MHLDQALKLVEDLSADRVEVKYKADGTWVNCCCLLPDHDDSNPSFGINVDEEFFNCFACGQKGSLVKLISIVNKCSYQKAREFLEGYGVKTSKLKLKVRKSAEDRKPKGIVAMATYKAGKICNDYLLSRGFTKETQIKFKFGWDAETFRVTIPVFNIKGEMQGLIKRAVLDEKLPNGEFNPKYLSLYKVGERYMIDSSISKSHSLYPLPQFSPDLEGVNCAGKDIKSAILVEGTLDAVKMHQNGLSNTLSIINSSVSYDQIDLLKELGVNKIYMMLDNDKAGVKGKIKMYKMLKEIGGFTIMDTTFPEGMNDPAELTYDYAKEMINNATNAIKQKYLHDVKKRNYRNKR